MLRNKYVLRLLAILVLGVVYTAGFFTLKFIESSRNKTATLEFSLPFPPDMEQKFDLVNVSRDLIVEKVVVAGFFSAWDADSEEFEMKKIGENSWRIKLSFPEGDNQYKFAVTAKKTNDEDESPETYWIYDQNSSSKIADGFNGYNSQYNPYDASDAKFYLALILGGFAALILIFSMLEPLFLLLLNMRMSFRYKIVFSAITFGLLTNIFFIAADVMHQRALARSMVVDFVNIVHVLLKADEIEFTNLAAETERINSVLSDVFSTAQGRFTKDNISNDQIVLNSVVVYDPDFKLLQYATREELVALTVARMEKLNFSEYGPYSTGFIFADAIKRMRKGKLYKSVAYGSLRDSDGMQNYRLHLAALGFSNFIKPIYNQNKLVGFYAAEVNVHLFGSTIVRNVIFLVLMLPLFLVFYFILFSIAGKWITSHMHTLLSYADRIRGGDFSAQPVIKSGDEIQELSFAFDGMRSTLKSNIAEIEETNRDLTRLKENLEIRVEERTSELASSNENLKLTNKSLVDARRVMDLDMKMAINVQSSFFLKHAPKSQEWETAFVLKPMAGIAGDLYDFYTDADGRLNGAALMDVSGHGIASGLITMIAKSVVYRNFMNGSGERLSRVIETINDDLIQELNNVDNYLTGILLRFRGENVEYVNAGHTELLVRRGSTGKTILVAPENDKKYKGFFLGLEAMRMPFTQINFKVRKDDVLLVYSDCLNETTNAAGEEFGIPRIMKAMNSAPEGSMRDLIEHVISEFNAFTGKTALEDDLTIFAMRRLV